MRILGIDPGYAIVGYGVVDYVGNKFKVVDFGAIETPKEMPFSKRLLYIFHELNDIIDRCRPDFMSVEELFFNTNVKTAIQVGHARGVILLSAEHNAVPVYEYTPLQVKQAIVGYGRADKAQVQFMTKTLLNLTEIPKPDDAADALALAVCHAHSYKFNKLSYL